MSLVQCTVSSVSCTLLSVSGEVEASSSLPPLPHKFPPLPCKQCSHPPPVFALTATVVHFQVLSGKVQFYSTASTLTDPCFCHKKSPSTSPQCLLPHVLTRTLHVRSGHLFALLLGPLDIAHLHLADLAPITLYCTERKQVSVYKMSAKYC